jgi:hypothetical protein
MRSSSWCRMHGGGHCAGGQRWDIPWLRASAQAAALRCADGPRVRVDLGGAQGQPTCMPCTMPRMHNCTHLPRVCPPAPQPSHGMSVPRMRTHTRTCPTDHHPMVARAHMQHAGCQRAGSGRALYQRQAAVVASTRSRPSRCVCARVGCVCARVGCVCACRPVVLPCRPLLRHGAACGAPHRQRARTGA